jgi:hypothetical protein
VARQHSVVAIANGPGACYNYTVKATQYGVVAFPKLDTEALMQRFRERFDPGCGQASPHVAVVQPFTPVNLDEIQDVADHVGRARRSLHAFTIMFHRCREQGDSLLFDLDRGREEFAGLRKSIAGEEPEPMLPDASGFDPRLWVGRIPDSRRRGDALAEANRIGRSLGVVDALHLVRVDGVEMKLVSRYPFGVGRVDLYERYPA